VRQIEDANRADQQRIFDTFRKFPGGDTATRNTVNREVGAIQLQIARRGQEMRSLREEIAKLEEELGLPVGGEAKK
jgi:hypothetical protein